MGETKKTYVTYGSGGFTGVTREVVQEYPLVLHVNGRELATLVASPHDLRFLVAGFLRLQGFVSSVEDFDVLSVCEDFGVASVRIRREIPERLKPILTSGCGTGITFSLPRVERNSCEGRLSPDDVFTLMDRLNGRTELYRVHGGIHSSAVARGRDIIIHAEDIGRHNTLDRIAGEALLKGIDLSGCTLVTSGRVSTEMAGKASALGISVIASRTSPTDQAVAMCRQAGITVIGYVRGGKFTVYSGEERIRLPETSSDGRVHGVTAVILAGGKSTRMGSNKALFPYRGGRFIEAIHRQLAVIFDEVVLVTNSPEQYDFLSCRKVPDLLPGKGPLSGIHSALRHSATPRVFVVGCDMPYLHDDLVRHVASRDCPEGGVVIPRTPAGLEPLHALYSTGCAAAVEEAIAAGASRIVSFFDRIPVKVVEATEIAGFDPRFSSFSNINTPQEYFTLRDAEKENLPPQPLRKAQ